MKHEKTRALYRYWDSVRGTRAAPRRLEIEPGAISGLLPNVFILERTRAGAHRFRLAGTHVCAYFGDELRERLFTSLWPDDEREAIDGLLGAIAEEAVGAVAGLEGFEPGGRVTPFELLLLPLATQEGRFERILGSIHPLDTAYWLGSWPVIALRVKSVRFVWPRGRRVAGVDMPNPAPLGEEIYPRGRFTVIDGGLSGTS